MQPGATSIEPSIRDLRQNLLMSGIAELIELLVANQILALSLKLHVVLKCFGKILLQTTHPRRLGSRLHLSLDLGCRLFSAPVLVSRLQAVTSQPTHLYLLSLQWW